MGIVKLSDESIGETKLLVNKRSCNSMQKLSFKMNELDSNKVRNGVSILRRIFFCHKGRYYRRCVIIKWQIAKQI